jgi:hypothetical protein
VIVERGSAQIERQRFESCNDWAQCGKGGAGGSQAAIRGLAHTQPRLACCTAGVLAKLPRVYFFLAGARRLLRNEIPLRIAFC